MDHGWGEGTTGGVDWAAGGAVFFDWVDGIWRMWVVGSLDRRGDREQSDRGLDLIIKKHAFTKAVAAGLDIPSEGKKGGQRIGRCGLHTHRKSIGRDPDEMKLRKWGM